MDTALGDLVLRECTAGDFADCDIIFSGLGSDVAGPVGECTKTDSANKEKEKEKNTGEN